MKQQNLRPSVLEHEDRTAARARVQAAMTKAAAIQKRMVDMLAEAVEKGRSK